MDWYKKPLILTENCSNNALSYNERLALNSGKSPQLYLPELVNGALGDVALGDEVVFEDFDDEGILRSCKGLRQYIQTALVCDVPADTEISEGENTGTVKIPVYIFDNHNHSFSFWSAERANGHLRDGALLIHVDQHKDARIPPSFLSPDDAKDLDKVFEFTNRVLNVGNFIPAAQHTGLVKDIIFIDSERSIDEFDPKVMVGRDIILDIDLDFFVPDLDYIGNEKKLSLLKKVIPFSKVITFATSPFFIDQKLALDWLVRIAG
ncbi:UPF0489 family protein [Candidatus Peregrinibacteria bacterium]|nr:UPF0489 family protein [Candidatus Peregrinibacteria bacterium]